MMQPEADPQEAPAVGADNTVQEAVWQIIDTPEPATQAPTPDNGQLLVALATAERQLAEAKNQIALLESLMEELPEIFERKFQQRLQPVMERQQQLLTDNRELQQQIRRLAPAPGEVRLRFNPDSQSGRDEAAIRLPQLPAQSSTARTPRENPSGRRRRAA